MDTANSTGRTPEVAVASAPVRLRGPLEFAGGHLLGWLGTVHGLGAFALITLGVFTTKMNAAARVIHPLIRQQIHQCGLRLLPMTSLIAAAVGFVVIGQLVSLLDRVGVQNLVGTVMVTAVVRELGPLATAMLVLGRAGATTVIELGMARAQGEVETLEALGIDPVHYLVVPRVAGMMLAVFALTVYLILGSLAAGYLFAFLQDVPLLPGDYVRQLAAALAWTDFILLALKTCGFGAIIAVAACYHGLARPISLREVSAATVRAVMQSAAGILLLDALFIVVYLLI